MTVRNGITENGPSDLLLLLSNVSLKHYIGT